MYVAYVLFECCKSRSGITYVAMSIHVCCKCVFQMFQLFSNVCYKWSIWMLHMLHWLYIYAASACFQMFQLFQMYVASVLSGCCICCSGHTRMLQVYVLNVFSCFKCMLQVFYLVVCICCSGHTHMLQEYVLNILSVLDVCCSKCFMLQVFHEQVWGCRQGGPRGHSSLACVGSKANMAAGACIPYQQARLGRQADRSSVWAGVAIARCQA
jgi:hypothetical protein